MKNLYETIRACVIFLLIMIIIFAISSFFSKLERFLSDDYTINISNWTYSTNKDIKEKEINLPWTPDYSEDNSIIHMKSKLPEISHTQPIFIKSAMKSVKVYIGGKEVYNSGKLDEFSSNRIYFFDVSKEDSLKEIELEVTSILPQSEGKIDSIEISSKSSYIIDLLRDNGLKSITAFSMIVIGLGVVCIFLIIFLGKKEYINIFFVGMFITCYGVWVTMQTDLCSILYDNPLVTSRLEMLSLYLLPIPLLLFIVTAYRIKHRKIIIFLTVLFTGFFLGNLSLYIIGLINLYQGLKIYHFMLLVGVLVLMYVLVVELKRLKKDFVLFFLGCITIIALSIVEMYIYYFHSIVYKGELSALGMYLFILALAVESSKYLLKLNHERVRNNTLMEMVYDDMSTGLKNKRAFDEDMKNFNNNLNQYTNLAILMIDLDDLKKTNDFKGHLQGDRLIFLAASILEEAYKKVGNVYRIGGDEFVVIFIDKTTEEIKACDEVRRNLIEEYSKNHNMNMSMSCGMAVYDGDIDSDIYEVFSRADVYMYEDKKKKKSNKI